MAAFLDKSAKESMPILPTLRFKPLTHIYVNLCTHPSLFLFHLSFHPSCSLPSNLSFVLSFLPSLTLLRGLFKLQVVVTNHNGFQFHSIHTKALPYFVTIFLSGGKSAQYRPTS